MAHFLAGEIPFLRIGELVAAAVAHFPFMQLNCYEDVMQADAQARAFVEENLL